jgi:putative transposase
LRAMNRHGLGPQPRYWRHIGHPGKPTTLIAAPNDVWTADVQGQFKTSDGLYGYPLTVADGFSRFLLGCQALSSTRVHEAKPVCVRLFKDFGLPKRIRTDHGVPCATTTLARLSQLSAPKPPDLQRTPAGPNSTSLTASARSFTSNARMKHATGKPPASRYASSPRKLPAKLPPLEYPDRFEVRDVSAKGGLRWNRQWINVSICCAGEYVGLEEIDDGVWNGSFGPLQCGWLLERQMRIANAYGRRTRHR